MRKYLQSISGRAPARAVSAAARRPVAGITETMSEKKPDIKPYRLGDKTMLKLVMGDLTQ